MQLEDLGLVKRPKPRLHSLSLLLGDAAPSHLLPCLLLSSSKWISSSPDLPNMDAHHHLLHLSPRAVSSWRSELDTPWIYFLFAGWIWKNRNSAWLWRSCRDLVTVRIHVKGVKEKNKSGEYTDPGIKNPVRHISTMKITSQLIFKARFRCTIRLLLLLLHCVGCSHGMPHVLRFGEQLLSSVSLSKFCCVYTLKRVALFPICWKRTFPPFTHLW